jgi:hypothetical protein
MEAPISPLKDLYGESDESEDNEEDTYNLLAELKNNPDIFYLILSKLPNNTLRNLCKINKDFRNKCNTRNFWERLWIENYGKPIPEGNIRYNYLRRNLLFTVSSILYKNRYYYKLGNMSRKEIEIRLEVEKDYNVGSGGSIIDGYTLKKAIVYNELDIVLFVILNYIYGELLRKYLIENGDPEFIEEILSNLSENEKLQFAHKFRLNNLIDLPRTKDNCNKDLVNLYFKDNININTYYMDIAFALQKSLDHHCKKLTGIILQNLKKVKNTTFIENVVAELTKRTKDYNIWKPILEKYGVYNW